MYGPNLRYLLERGFANLKCHRRKRGIAIPLTCTSLVIKHSHDEAFQISRLKRGSNQTASQSYKLAVFQKEGSLFLRLDVDKCAFD